MLPRFSQDSDMLALVGILGDEMTELACATRNGRWNRASQGAALLAVLCGFLLTLAVRGYQFGQSNHTVYLIDALRRVDPSLLQNDWWANATLQYHALFSSVTGWLVRTGQVEPFFFAAYLLLIGLMHFAWLRLARAVGLSAEGYLLSVLIYYLSAGGLGLGSYQFLQDGALLPSNISAVAMLWSLVLWVDRRWLLGGLCLGLAGLFHLNFAVVAGPVWGLWSMLAWGEKRRAWLGKSWLGGTLLGAAGALASIAPAVGAILTRSESLPLDQFVDLYVRLRHPHHYDPSSWSWMLWLAFIWPIPLAALWLRTRRFQREVREIWATMLFFLGMLILALLGAGLWYASESLVQMSLFRFSIYVKLIACVGAAGWMIQAARPRGGRVLPALAGITLLASLAAALLMPAARARFNPGDDPDYLALCDMVRQQTDSSAIFLVPPSEQSFRLRARRAIVVNFKGVPQLSSELAQWRERLCDVLQVDDLSSLPCGLAAAEDAMRLRYDRLSPEQLHQIARRWGATYVVASHSIEQWKERLVCRSGKYQVYAIGAD